MSFVVNVDDRGRIILPLEVRRRLGLRKGSRLILRLRGDRGLEAVPLQRELEEVAGMFVEKFKGWREGDHEASKILIKMVGKDARNSRHSVPHSLPKAG